MDIGATWLILAICAIAALVALPRKAGLYLQFLAIAMSIAVLLTFAGCGREEYDPGGSPSQELASLSDASRLDEPVANRGVCNSSCALKLTAGRNLCVSPTAEIGVHEVRDASPSGNYAGGARDNLWTGFFEGMLPACARNLFNARDGFASGQLTVVSGSDVLQACPTMRACTQ